MQKGLIDLRHWDFYRDGIVKLNGSWEFYPRQHLAPGSRKSENFPSPGFTNVPTGRITSAENNMKLPAFGYGTYRVKVLLNKNNTGSDKLLALSVSSVASSYGLWIDSSPAFGSNMQSGEIQNFEEGPAGKIFFFVPHSDTVTITIQYTNNIVPFTSGITRPVSIGYSRQITGSAALIEYFFIAGAVFSFSFGLYFLFLSIVGRERKLNFLVFLLCMANFVRYSFDEVFLINAFLPHISGETYLKIISLSPVIIFITFWITYHLFPAETRRKAIQSAGIIYALYTLAIIALPFSSGGLLVYYMIIFTMLILLYLTAVTFIAFLRKKELAGIFFSSILVSSAVFFIKMFVIEDLLPIGTILQISILAVYITKKMSISHNRVVKLSGELQAMNENLDMLVASRTKELDAANESLRKLNFVKDKFISILSHDLRNPLGNLIGLSRRLVYNAGNNDAQKTAAYSRMINESASACYSLAENLLDWSLIQSGSMAAVPERIVLKDAADEVYNLLKNAAAEKNIELVNSIGPCCEVYADARMTGSILRNLVTNAIKFTNSRGRVEISAVQSGAFWEICVADTGIGMEKEDLENLFRLDRKVYNLGTSDEQGTGFGLIVTREFIVSNGGTVEVKSEKDKGTAVTFTLPAYMHEGNEK